MEIEKLDRVVVYVESIERSKKRFSELLGIDFEEIPMGDVQPMSVEPGPGAAAAAEGGGGAPMRRVVISRVGLELIEGPLEPGQPSRVACFHFKVPDYDGAKAEMERKRLPLLADITLGTLREAIYQPEGADAPLMGLVSYPGDWVMDAIRTKA